VKDLDQSDYEADGQRMNDEPCLNRIDYTVDCVEIKPGLRVFTIDCRWGTVISDESAMYGEGWWYVDEDDHGYAALNGERICTRDNITGTTDPKGATNAT
jgi:hypothetical protein